VAACVEWWWFDVIGGQTSEQLVLVECSVVDHRLQTNDRSLLDQRLCRPRELARIPGKGQADDGPQDHGDAKLLVHDHIGSETPSEHPRRQDDQVQAHCSPR
jgi:hypothetical protein